MGCYKTFGDRLGIFCDLPKVFLISDFTFVGLSFLILETGRKRTPQDLNLFGGPVVDQCVYLHMPAV